MTPQKVAPDEVVACVRPYAGRGCAPPGEVAPRVSALIAAGCVVTVAIALLGMDSMWGSADWIEQSPVWGVGRSEFLYTHGLPLLLMIAMALAFAPRFDVSRVLRIAVLLPVFHLAAIVIAAFAWTAIHADIDAVNEAQGWKVSYLPNIGLPSSAALVVAFGAVFAIAITIKWRRGEWAHAGVMLTLSYLLLVGLWLPILSRLSISSSNAFNAANAFRENCDFGYGCGYRYYWAWQFNHRILSREAFTVLAIVPPMLVAIAFTAIAFRSPRLFNRLRAWPRLAVKLLLGGGVLAALTLPDEGWLLYLESSYLVLFAVILAVGALITLTVITRLGSLASHFSFGRLPKVEGTIARDEQDEVARFEVTSWLRGPRLAVRSFVVATPNGNVPLDGVTVLARVPASTTALDVGEHAPVLAPGDRVIIGGRKGRTGAADPFRTIEATDVAAVAGADARAYRFSDVALVVWRPAVAYLAILVAVALPYLSIVLT
ncbi:MAG TPA: hypothetical protein VFV99_00550 [Kofleriaceae bacterium]|nr:hypothetical protein [Kofleriaceae bacterium]